MSRKSALIIGLDRYLLDACRELDYDMVVVYGAAVKDFAFYPVPSDVPAILVDDQRSLEAVLAGLARAGHLRRSYDLVITSDEMAVVTAAALGAHFEAQAVPLDVAVNFRDKSVQKAIVTAAGIPTASYQPIPDILDLPDDFELPYSPAVLKPVAGAATSLTSMVRTTSEARELSESYRKAGVPTRTFIVEDVSHGEEWFVDGFMFEGTVAFFAIGRYLKTCLTTVVENTPLQLVQLDPVQEQYAYEAAGPLVQKALTALGLRSGPFHMELFADPDTGSVVFGECAARRGGVLTQDAVLAKFGVDLARGGVQSLAGEKPDFDEVRTPAVVGSTFLPCPPGVLADHPTPDEILGLPGVVYAQIELPRGFPMPDAINNAVGKLGQALLVADTHAELFERMNEVTTWVTERTRTLRPSLPPRLLRLGDTEPFWAERRPAASH
ncbi:acetyl-CoA carboxylase biotin carboxylase subunit family protein [Streptomyces nigra]|uniref:ATP-grasp domain-containing protein n=1 Tax=Streptomyces nigra TaxID=1827580 RepID=UPI00369A2E61